VWSVFRHVYLSFLVITDKTITIMRENKSVKIAVLG